MQSSTAVKHLRRGHDDHRQIDRSGDVRRRAGTRGARRSRAPSGGPARCVPVKPAATRLCRISEPILPRSRLAPTTATTRGSKNAFIDAVAAVRDRAAALSAKASVVDGERQRDVADAVLDRAGHRRSRSRETRRASAGCRRARRRRTSRCPARARWRRGARAGACRCRGPAARRRRRTPLRRDSRCCGSR